MSPPAAKIHLEWSFCPWFVGQLSCSSLLHNFGLQTVQGFKELVWWHPARDGDVHVLSPVVLLVVSSDLLDRRCLSQVLQLASSLCAEQR